MADGAGLCDWVQRLRVMELIEECAVFWVRVDEKSEKVYSVYKIQKIRYFLVYK